MDHITHHRPQNAARQQAAYETLRLYTEIKETISTGENFDADLEGYITDLLTDLRHLCAASGIDFDAKVNGSAMHYAAETSADK